MFLRRLLTYIFILFACLASYGQVNQVLWGKGKALYANPIATIDSLTYGQLLYGDTLYIIFDRESKRIVYDTIHVHMPGIVFHDTIYTTDTIYLESGRRIGVFSVAADKQVTFSQGNLQYTQSTDTWQFANEQWECIGAGNIKEGTLADKIDLFGWSANNTTAPWGISLSTNNADYAGEFVDWGENIINSDAPNTWRTLTNAEWEYVLNGRDNASQLRCRAQVDHVNGFVFLPDEWVYPDGIELNLEQPTTKVFTRDEWSKMENAGAVFLPAAGRIDNKKLVNFDDHGNYWSSTRINDQWVDYLAFTFSSNKLYVDHQRPIYLGRSVRLVRDTIVPKPEYVDLGLSVKWATFNVGATSPEDYGDYFAWGETEPKEEYTWETYKWGTSGKLTKYNTTDGKTILDPEDDAAYVNWGDKWRMPTDAERDELVENCTWTWTTQNSVNGYKVTGPNGNSIFLPAGGYKGSGPDYPVGEDGLYWLGNVYKNSYAYLFTIQHEVTPPSTEGKQGTRCFGFMIRPIYDDRPPKRIGVFSVAADKQVSFSQGNLQYTQSTDEWRFAREQHEYIGAANIKDGALADRIDLFGWSANNTTAPFGVSTSTNVADYAGTFVDWGTNEICGDKPNTWRTLSADEWKYLFEQRKNALQLRSKGSIDGHRGHILLPDDWVLPEGVQFVAEPNNLTMDLDINSYTQAEWRIMEEAGAIFLPAAGRRDGTTVGYLVEYSGLWSSTSTTNTNAFHTYYNYESQIIAHHWTSGTSRINGRSVRLVHDTVVPPPEPCLVVKVNDTLSINMMCVEGGTFMMGAMEGDTQANANEKPAHQVTLSDYYMSDVQVSQALWEYVMGTTIDEEVNRHGGDKNIGKGSNYPMYCIDWFQANEFAAKLSRLTGLLFSLPSEAEWEYAARGGQLSRGYKFAGSNNLDEVAWWGDPKGLVHPSAQKKPNELGIYDMCGNICEWTLDGYSNYTTEAQTNPCVPRVDSVVQRSMSSHNAWKESDHRTTFRYKKGPNHAKTRVGFRLVLHDTVPEPPKRIGVFSVAADKQVSFSQGNLQYTQSTDEWRFAREQYEYIGAANIKDGALADRIDLFGWSANNTTAPFGVSTSTNAADYAGDFVDWGVNTIQGDAPNTWRTLSADEWEYVFKKRKNASNLYGVAQVAGVNGMIILPDHWEASKGIVFKSGLHSSQVDNYSVYQSFTYDQWLAMENAGAVFLPALGYRDGTNVEKCNTSGYYWSNTTSDEKTAYRLYFYSYFLNPNDVHSIYRGRSVRLVHDTIVPEVIPDPCLVVKVNDTLSINMMCVEGGTFTMGDGDNAHPVSLSSYSIGQTEVTQALWEAVMGTNPSANTTNKQLPVTNISWYDCQEFINRLNQLTGLRFRLPTEAEWEYAARGGQKSKGYTYAGSNDLKEVAWYNGNSGNTLHAVAQKKPNELGICDMSGNAWEWCHDWHAPYPTTHQYNPLGPEVGQIVGTRYLRVFRGGSYGYEAAYHQNTFRDITGPEPDKGTANLGLRLVLSDEINFQTIHVNDTLSFHMMDVKGGTFTMGDDNISNASPTHQVTLSDYYIGETEVTQALWKAVMGDIPTGNKNPSNPIGYVSYADCQNFIAKLNNLTGLYFQLPTEAEWEYAAMGGNRSHDYLYSGSNTIDDVAWYDQNSGNKMHNVGAKQPNELGIYDMSGNAWEWCADYHGKYTAENQINPQGPATGTDRVLRSGSFRTIADRCTNKHRQARDADYPDSHITLRLVLHDTTPEPPKRIGVFSVAADKQVIFSQGNLQYIQSTDTWQFADHQWEYMGYNHYRNGQLADTIEYFGWSGKNSKAPWGISLSTELADYEGEFLDWGTNTIAGSAPNTWRTLSNEELLYICKGRKNADQLLGLGKIDTICGLIILPDDWVAPDGIIFTPNTDNPDANPYNLQQWTAMENAGAVFIPPTGYFNHKMDNMRGVHQYGYYRNSTLAQDGRQIYSLFSIIEDGLPNGLSGRIRYSYSGNNQGNLFYAFPVRLVHDTIVPKSPKRIGVFSVGAGKKVSFSQGNLQYTQSTDTWRFAREQYDYLGEGNLNDGQLANRIDLFGWSASGNTVPFGVSTSTNAADYAGDFVDWGVNTIQGDAPNTWRTLSKEEWEYLLNGRENAEQLRTKGSVEGKEGVILLPDSWICPEGYTIAIIPDEANLQPNVNTYSQADWSKLEDAGAIILPSAGTRRNAIELEVIHPNIFGGYWTCTNKDEHNSYCYTFHTQDCEYVDYSNHRYGRSVRLVHDTIVPLPIPEPCHVVKVNDTLSINMMCVEGGTFMMGQGEDKHQVSLSNYSIAQTEVTQGLWEQVMGYNNSLFKGEYLPVEKVSWEECQTFIQKLNEMTGKHFRLPTEAEWEYAARGGKNSRGYTYAGSNSIDSIAWYQSNSQEQTHTIATLMPNELGIYDMSGNVWEWCQDYYDASTQRVVRGGSFYDVASVCRISSRSGRDANYRSYIGLRLVLDELPK